jgi:hypothetical protein
MSVSKCYRSLNDFACEFGMTFKDSEGRSYLIEMVPNYLLVD